MSDLKIFLDRISTGQCILLTGAGFSRCALNFINSEIPDARKLTEIILAEINVSHDDRSDFDLSTATTKFMRDTANDARRLSALIAPHVTTQRTSNDQQKIAIQPWTRIYTTNFDDVLERALSERLIYSDSFSRAGEVQRKNAGRQQIIHLHGYIQDTNPSADPDRFVLSLESYADRKLTDSAWLAEFRMDARRASAIFVIGFGYSNQDTHLGNLFLTDESIKSKTAIITSPTANLATRERLASYGTVFAIGTEGIASHLPNDPIKVLPPTHVPKCLREFTRSETTPIHSAEDVDSLLMKGALSYELTRSQITRQSSTPQYIVERATPAFEQVHRFKSHRILVVHSDIGNGKTVFAAELATRLLNTAFRVFEFRPEYFSDHATPVSFIESLNEDTAVIVEDFLSHRTLVHALYSLGRTNVLLILTCRTNAWELQLPSIDADIAGRYREENLNTLKRDESIRWIDYLISYGYWRDKAALSAQQKQHFIATKCKSEIRGILLALLDSPQFRTKLDAYFKKISSLPAQAHELIVYSSFLRFINFNPSDNTYFLSVLMNKDYLQDWPRIPRDSGIFELIATGGEITFKSSIFGEYYLREYVPDDILLTLLSNLAHEADQKRNWSDKIYRDLLRRMLRYSVIRGLMHRRDGKKVTIDFFEKNAALGIARDDPLYWVQYSIARMDDGRFDLCENYIEQAYGIAKKRIHYDTYQIDTHNSRFLLTSRMAGYKPDFFEAFTKAHRYVAGVLNRREEDLIYPLQVSLLYLDFFHCFKERLTEKEIRKIIEAADFILEKIRGYPSSLLERNSVGQNTSAKMKELREIASTYL